MSRLLRHMPSVVGLALTVTPTSAQTYTIVDLGHLAASETGHRASDVNMARQAVGQANTGSFSPLPVLFEGGAALPLPLPVGFPRGDALGINALGQVVGTVNGGGPFFPVDKAVVWPTGVGGSPVLLNGRRANDLNSAGTIVGDVLTITTAQAVTWTIGGSASPNFLTTLGGTAGAAWGINEAGVIVGSSALPGFGLVAASWPDAISAPTSLGALPGGSRSEAYGISTSGLIAGYSWDAAPAYEPGAPKPTRSVYWDADGVIHQIGTFTPDTQALSFDINDTGTVVGYGGPYPHGNHSAFLYSPECGLQDLAAYLSPGSVFSSLEEAYAINERGDIVGVGTHATCCTEPHAYMMKRNTLAVGSVVLPCGTVTTTELIAGQHFLAGSVCVANDGENLCIEYKADPGWALCEVHLEIVTEYSQFPLTGSGNPKVGKFEKHGDYRPAGAASASFCFSLAALGYEPGDTILIAAHAAMCNGETAWGAGSGFGGSNWATYFSYEVQDCCH